MTTLYFKTLFYFLFCLTVSVGQAAEKKLLLLGGGGEPQGETTIFDGQLGLLSRFSGHKSSKWDVALSFNGGHKKTESLLESKFKKAQNLGDFNAENFDKSITLLKQQMLDGPLKSGDQLMILLTTHGAIKKPDELTHSVALSRSTASDLKNLSGSSTVSLDKLEEVIALADEKGIKLGLIDLSCFSGSTIKLARPSTCIISATGDKNYGYTEIRKPDDASPGHTFTAKILQQMKPGMNLEDLFLKARAENNTPDFPMISTATGKLVNELIYDFIHPYLNYNQSSDHDFSEMYDEKNWQQSICRTEERYSEIMGRMNEITKLAMIPAKLLNTSKLKKALEAYRDYQMKYEKDWIATRQVSVEVKEIIKRDYPEHAKIFQHEDGTAILETDYQSSLNLYKNEMEKAKDDWSREFYKGIYDNILLKQKISSEISKKLSPGSAALLKKFDKTFSESGITKRLAEDVSYEARKLYEQLYKAKKDNAPNPCKDFVL